MKKVGRAFGALCAVVAVLLLGLAGAEAAGPYATTTGLYQFLDRSEPLVATDRKVDLWAEVYRPRTLSAKPFPLIVFLHGNHGTCGRYSKAKEARVDDRIDYTTTGKCPPGYVVTPNHLGYTYLAGELASYGYIVVSINANRGITAGFGVPGDAGLNLMRGRLILRHLALLSGWNRGTGPIPPPVSLGFNPVGTMDFAQVGLMGHSRGGEGTRAALQQFRDPGSPFPPLIGPITFRSIFEIAPVDGQTSRVLDANGVYSMILLPSCDGDVYNLQGMKVFDRVFLNHSPDPKQDFHGTTYVWGADHNAYNTQWQIADSPGCVGTDPLFPQAGVSKPQQVTSRETLVPFFRATVGAKSDLSLARLFDPTNPVPSTITEVTNVDRGYLPAPLGPNVKLLEAFSSATESEQTRSSETSVGIHDKRQEASFEHQVGTRVATVSWGASSPPQRYLQINLAPGQNIGGYEALTFRTALRCFGNICKQPASDKGEMSYGVSLVDTNGQVSNMYNVRDEVRLSRPIGPTPQILHSTLYSVQVPFSAFTGVNFNHIKSVRFTFEQRGLGTVDVTDLAFLKKDPLSDGKAPSVVIASGKPASTASAAAYAAEPSVASPGASADGNTLKIVRPSTSQAAPATGEAGGAAVDLVLSSKRAFPVTDAFPKLTVGDKVIEGGTLAPDGKTLTVTVPAPTFDSLAPGSQVSLFVQASAPVWQFGPLPK